MKKLLIFDLDGTLIDSVSDIASSVNRLRRNHGLAPLPEPTIRGFIGNGVRHLLELAMEPENSEALDSYQKEYLRIYGDHLLDETAPYPGVRAGLESLRDKTRLAVLTNKPEFETSAILEGLDLTIFFEKSFGGDSLEYRKPNPIGIDTLRSIFEVDRAETLMIGDSLVDRETAGHAGVEFCLVTYGLGSAEALSEGADHVIQDLTELRRFVS